MNAPARCSGCGKVSDPRPLGRTPEGWMRGQTAPGDDAQGRYWCPDCAEAAGWTDLFVTELRG